MSGDHGTAGHVPQGPDRQSVDRDKDRHYRTVAKALDAGRVVPLLGAGINLSGSASDERWMFGSSRLPTSRELAMYLADEFDVTDLKDHELEDLVRVAQAVAVVNGRAWLYEKLHEIFDVDHEPTLMHRFLAALPGALRERGSAAPYQLILTTNYDDTLERAFLQAGEPYDLIWYMAEHERPNRGRFWARLHPQSQTEPIAIERPNEYDQISLEDRTVILKFHGAIDRTEASRDSYVITEDHYIDYLTRAAVVNLIPVELVAKLTRSHFLFLAYALRDWNVRVILHRIWAAQTLDYPSWAIQRETHPLDRRLWDRRGVEIVDEDLSTYARRLAEYMNVPIGFAARACLTDERDVPHTSKKDERHDSP
jgi:hypothetical protein